MPRFVILEHDWPTRHWDLLLEAGPILRAWRLLTEPTVSVVPAQANADHRLFYLDHEGPVSGDRGTVARWDSGTFDWIAEGSEYVAVELRGSKLTGPWRIEQSPSGLCFVSVS